MQPHILFPATTNVSHLLLDTSTSTFIHLRNILLVTYASDLIDSYRVRITALLMDYFNVLLRPELHPYI